MGKKKCIIPQNWIKPSWTFRFTAQAFPTYVYQSEAECVDRELHWESNQHFAVRFPDWWYRFSPGASWIRVRFWKGSGPHLHFPPQVCLWLSSMSCSCSSVPWLLSSPASMPTYHHASILCSHQNSCSVQKSGASELSHRPERQLGMRKISILLLRAARGRCQIKNWVAG